MDFRIHNIKSILSWDPIQDKLVCKDDKEIFISNGVIKNIDNKVNQTSNDIDAPSIFTFGLFLTSREFILV